MFIVQQFHQKKIAFDKMKRVLQNDCKIDKNDRLDMLWKKIGKAPKPLITNNSAIPCERFETSLELHLLNTELGKKYSQIQQKPKNLMQTENEKQKVKTEDKKELDKIPFQPSLLKLSESTYNIETAQQINKQVKEKMCSSCFSRFQQGITKLKQQIKLILIDYKILKQQIKLQIKSYWNQVEELIKNNHFMPYHQLEKLDEDVLKIRIDQKKSLKDKLQYIQIQNTVRKAFITKLQQQLQRLNQQNSLLEQQFFEIKIANLAQNSQLFNRINSKNTPQRKKVGVQKPRKLYTEYGEIESLVRSTKSQQQGKNEQIEIQIIKKKLNGLKIRLNKTCSNID